MGAEGVTDLGARISGAPTEIANRVTTAIRDAARTTGAGFEYLLNTAARESNFDPNAKSPNSSATGLFQFLDQTWLATLKTSGPGLGYGKYADAITQTASGTYTVSDPAMLRDIMALRKDPAAAAAMGGAFANANAKTLTEQLGRKPTDGELYIAHFLGAGGAVQLIKGAQTQPNTPAANLFPKAAAANGPVFYDKTGAPRSLREVYNFIVARHDAGLTRVAAKPASAQPVPAAAPLPPPLNVTSTRPPVPIAPPLVAAANQTAVPANSGPYTVEVRAPIAQLSTGAAAQRPAGPIFHGLYNDGNRGAVAPVVRELWGVRHGMQPQTEQAVAPAQPAATSQPQTRPPVSFFQSLRSDGST